MQHQRIVRDGSASAGLILTLGTGLVLGCATAYAQESDPEFTLSPVRYQLGDVEVMVVLSDGLLDSFVAVRPDESSTNGVVDHVWYRGDPDGIRKFSGQSRTAPEACLAIKQELQISSTQDDL